MSLQSEIEEGYQDANLLVAPRRCHPLDKNPSGNGICYTGEYMTLLKLRGELDAKLESDFFHSIFNCWVAPGLLQRGPAWTGPGESIDDYYGLAAGCVATDHQELAELVLDYGWAHKGSFNDREPGKWTWTTFLWRQPQLLFALYCAAGRAPKWYRPFSWWLYPLELFTALVIGTSCIGAKYDNWDARRLAWLLIRTVSPSSFISRCAAEFWYHRLFSTYTEGMRGVAQGYYESFPVPHPFIAYSKTR